MGYIRFLPSHFFIQTIYHTWANFNPQHQNSYARTKADFGVGKRFEENYFAGTDANGNKTAKLLDSPFSFKAGWEDYSSAFEFGEAPENLLAIENVATLPTNLVG